MLITPVKTEERHILYEKYVCVDLFWIIHFLFSTLFSSLLHNNEKETSLAYGFRTGTEYERRQRKKTSIKGNMRYCMKHEGTVTSQWLSVYQRDFYKSAKCRCNLPVCLFTHGIERKDTAFNFILGFTGTRKDQGSCKRRETCTRQQTHKPGGLSD